MRSTFDELSQEISSEEKKILLGKIQASLNLSTRDTESIISKASGREELKHRLTREVSKLTLWDRIMLKISAFFRAKPEYEVMGEKKLSGAKSTLRDRIPELISFSREEWSPELAKVFYDFYWEAQALRPVFDHLFQQKLTLESGLLQLIGDVYPDSVHDLDDLFPEDEIARLYRVDQKRATLFATLEKQLQDYCSQVPASVFDTVKERLKTLYYLRPLVQFPYPFLFELFGHNPDKTDPAKYPYFLGAPWRKTGTLLERFYYGVYLAAKLEFREGSINLVLEEALQRVSEGSGTESLDAVNQRLANLSRLARETMGKVPWKEVLQWSFQDPYYGIKYVLPQFSIRDFYENALLMRFRSELEEQLPSIRQSLLTEERALLFQGASFRPLEFYVAGVGAAEKVRGFQYPETLSLLWGFLQVHFAQRVVPFQQSLLRLVPPGNRTSLQLMVNTIEELQTLKLRLTKFDQNLHPDAEEGKEFQRLRMELNSKALSLKPFLDMVQDNDAKAQELIQRGLEGIQILINQFSSLRDRNVPVFRSMLKLPYLLEGQQETVEQGLDRLLVILQKSLFVLKETFHLEA